MILTFFSASISRTFFPTATILPRASSLGLNKSSTLSWLLSSNTHAFTTKATTPKSLPANIPIEEEKVPGYDPKFFYHPNPNDIVNGKYELKAKLGYGTTSTVWLAQDTTRWRIGSSNPYVAIKFNDNRAHDEATSKHELDILQHIASLGSGESGRRYIRTVSDSFEISGPHGSHFCLVFEPMREPIWLLRRRLGGDKVTREFLPIFKMYIMALLNGLEFLHGKCRVIHTDLKLDNILLDFEGTSVIDEFIQAQVHEPMPRKIFDDYTVYLSHNDFGPLQIINGTPALMKMCPKITDFGLAQRGDRPRPLLHPIQPAGCHAPEVLLGTGWSYSADIWNFGVMVWNLLAGESIFQRLTAEDGTYSARHHLAEMIALLGPIPLELIRQERSMRRWRWTPSVVNYKGRMCDNAADFFGGPFFDDAGSFVAANLVARERTLEGILPECIADGDVESFLGFMRQMLCWIPGERATAKELQEHPWLKLS